jgi:hypothetical protein
MHLVFVTSLVPDGEPTTGYEIANQSIIAALRRGGVKVTSLGFNWAGKPAAAGEDAIILGEVDVRSETAGASDKAGWVMKALVNSLTISSAKLRILPEQAIRSALVKAEPYDGYVINGVTMAGAFQSLFNDKPSIYVAHNVEHVSAEENAQTADGAVKRLFFRREARLLRELELALARRAACTMVLAEEDRLPLNVAGEGRSVVLPLVTRQLPPRNLPKRTIEHDAGLIGTWTWQPNRVGLEWFIREVVPHLPKDFTIGVAGHIPAGFGGLPQQVRALGRVPDAQEFVRSCAVIPLVSKAGTGVQLKTIETFELGLPCVATSHSLRGFSAVPDNCVRVEDPAAFAASLAGLAAKVRSGALPDGDGSAFHAGQIAGQDRAAALALRQLALQISSAKRKAA